MDKRPPFKRLDEIDAYNLFKDIKTPFYIIDKACLEYNGKILKNLQDETGCKILLAQKCFSNYDLYKTLEPFLAGTEASGLYEAKLGHDYMAGKEVHTFCGAYRDDEFDEVVKYSDHIIFNSINQLKKFGPIAKSHNKSIGVRINPEKSTQIGHEMYDPCNPLSRLGITIADFKNGMTNELLSMLDGIHFHTLCQQNSIDLEVTLDAVEEKFGCYLSNLKWINFGGGHHITRDDYDIEKLKKCINHIKNKYNVEVYLEPGEAVVLNAGYLVSRVLDTYMKNGMQYAIADTSAACHFADALECPFLPPLYEANMDDNKYQVRIGGPTCLAGDNIGLYSFNKPVVENQMLIFGDMALYTTVKNNTFNGMPLPNIYVLNQDNSIEKLTDFGYDDFKYRLGRK